MAIGLISLFLDDVAPLLMTWRDKWESRIVLNIKGLAIVAVLKRRSCDMFIEMQSPTYICQRCRCGMNMVYMPPLRGL